MNNSNHEQQQQKRPRPPGRPQKIPLQVGPRRTRSSSPVALIIEEIQSLSTGVQFSNSVNNRIVMESFSIILQHPEGRIVSPVVPALNNSSGNATNGIEDRVILEPLVQPVTVDREQMSNLIVSPQLVNGQWYLFQANLDTNEIEMFDYRELSRHVHPFDLIGWLTDMESNLGLGCSNETGLE